jgi:hypothetical protein
MRIGKATRWLVKVALSIEQRKLTMIKVSEESEGNFPVLDAQDKLTDQDYQHVLIPRLETIICERGNARLLRGTADDFQGWELKVGAWTACGTQERSSPANAARPTVGLRLRLA